MTPQPVNLLFVAQGGWKRKGLHLVLDACRRLTESHDTPWVLEILGMPGNGEAELLTPFKEYIDAGQIHPLGFQKNVAAAYARADLLIVGSFYEAFSLVMLEALTHGLPIITTPVNGAREAVRDGWNGFIVNWDKDSMAEAIYRLANDVSLRTQMGERSREMAALFDLNVVASQTEAVYRQVSGG
jgi:glycosyltransferase involved in cell wall biosynthesis